MTFAKASALLFSVMLAVGALAGASGPVPEALATPSERLTAISSRVSGKGTSLVIEASAPVPYVATRPDPLTVLVDFRNVAADGVATSVGASGKSAGAKSPIASVAVEAAESMGAPASRVRVTLAQPVGYRVRSDRNTVVVDFEKPSGKAVPYVLPPASRQKSAPDAMEALEIKGAGTAAPDAMKALDPADAESAVAVDPIAALGIGKAPASSGVPAATNGAPVVASAALQPAATLSGSTAVLARTNMPALPGAQATEQPPVAPPPAQQPAAPSKYSGHAISLDFQGADLRAVLRVFAEESGLNIVIDPKVTGTVDVALRDVPWDQALDIILRANSLGYVADGTIIRIAPLSVLAAEQKERSDLAKAQADAGQTITQTKQLSYAKAEDLQGLLTKSVLSTRGTVQVDPRTNTLIITDLSDRLISASDLIATLDKPQPQVEIEARIVQANKSYARALGVKWGFNGRVDPALGNTTNLAFPNNGSISGRTGGAQGAAGSATGTQPTGVNLALPGSSNITPTSAVGLALGSINGAFNLDLELSAAENSGNARILSTPRVSTQNNGEAEITQGVQIPVQTIANNTVTVTFKDAALTLKVTPQITAANTVIMKIQLENAQPDFSRAVTGIPPINTQRANTTVLVNDGQTTVIGGIYSSQEQTSNDKTPGLARVPLLGWLFKRDTLSNQSTELLIFITPKITRG